MPNTNTLLEAFQKNPRWRFETQCFSISPRQYFPLVLVVFPRECLNNDPLLTSVCVLCRFDCSLMTVQSLGVAFYSRGSKHSENNSDNRSETQQQEKSGRNFLVTIVSVSENSNI